MDANLFDSRLTCAVVESPFNYWVSRMLQDAGLLQIVLIVQQSIH